MLWTTDTVRCVLDIQLQPPAYAVTLFEGARLVYTDVVEHPEQAGEVAATLFGIFGASGNPNVSTALLH